VSLNNKLTLLRDRASRALGSHQVAEAVAKYRAIIGPSDIPASEVSAQTALEKLHRGEVPEIDELAALEIVVRLLRPVVFSRDGALDDLPDSAGHNLYPQELKDHWSDFRQRVKDFVYSVGRVETRDGRHIGTGFLVRPELLATNRHVLGALTYGAEVLAPGAARVVFKQEIGLNNAPSDTVRIEGVAAIHPTLDLVLLMLAQQQRRPVVIEPEPIKEGARMVVLGYPGKDEINNPLFLHSVFNDKFGFRRAALGEVLDGTESPVLFHDASTTQGNSGSPIFSLGTARVAGIHRSGFFMYRNEGVDADQLRAFVDNAKH
jgi:V8-like Glu-specific endopeptidase